MNNDKLLKASPSYFMERHQGGDQAVLVHIDFTQHADTESLLEFQELVRSAGGTVQTTITGKKFAPEAKYFVGKGKAEEIQHVLRECNADLVVFNHELTPAQERNLEKLLQCRVLDRTGLILDIFAQRAQTFEGKLQVELAQLNHLSTRLVRGWSHLERQRGGIGLRGPGETQLEADRRMIGTRIKFIHKRLQKIVCQREQRQRARKRSETPTITIVGYTNAGKSTLFNTLTESHVYVADQLFATLDPTLRRLQLPYVGEIVLADTVGFIRDLPHDLIAAFRATLEATRESDLLLHVIDVSAPNSTDMIQNVEEVLKEIEAHEVPSLLVFNKIDRLDSCVPHVDYDELKRPRRVYISAQRNIGIDVLKQAITELLSDKIENYDLILQANEGKLRSQLYKMDVVKHETIDKEGRMHLQLEMQRKDYQRLLISRAG